MSAIHQERRPGALPIVGGERSPIYERIERLVSGLRYGTVEITVHDGRIVQIDRTEKIRMPGATLDDRRGSRDEAEGSI